MKKELILNPGAHILLLDGSNYSDASMEHLALISNKAVELVRNEDEATHSLSSNPHAYAALFTEPMTYYTRTHMRAGYRDFLESVRATIPVIIYSTQSESTSDKSYGIEEWELVKGKHYDGFVSKSHPDEKKQVITLLEQIAKKG